MEEVIEKPSTELTVQARAAIALASDKTRQDLIAMATKFVAITEIKNKAGRDECHSAAMTLAGARIAISKTGKAARDDATKFSKAIIAEEASLIAITEPEEKRLLALRDGWDEVIAAEKAAKEAAERARILAITERIAGIRQYVELAASCRTSERIAGLLAKLESHTADGYGFGSFDEFADEAESAYAATHAAVFKMHEEKTEQEAEQARIKAEQAEAAAKLVAERAAFEAAQAAAKVEAERVAKELADQAAAAKAEADRVAAEHAAQVAADKAKAKAEADAMAELVAKRNAEFEAETKRQNAALAAERAAQAAEQQRAFKEAKDAQDKMDAEHMAERKRFAEEKAAFEAQVAEAKRVAKHLEQDRLDALREIETPPAPEWVAEIVLEPADKVQAAIKEVATPSPTDGDVVWTAASEVADNFGWTYAEAIDRLAAIDWSKVDKHLAL